MQLVDYAINEDVRVREDTFRVASKIIGESLRLGIRREEEGVKEERNLTKGLQVTGNGKEEYGGDILVFVPGMFEIKYLKDLLL